MSYGEKKMDKIEGFLEVGRNEDHEVVINHPDLKPDESGIRHIVFSPRQARNLANLLIKHATWAEAEKKGINPMEITGGGPATGDNSEPFHDSRYRQGYRYR